MRRRHSRYSNGKRGRFRQNQTASLILLVVVSLPVIGDDVVLDPTTDRELVAESLGAIRRAEDAIRAVLDVGNLWLGTRALLARASALQNSGDNTGAAELAHIAETHARLALNQYRLEEARYIYGKLKLDPTHDPNHLRAIDGLLRAYDGVAALQLARNSGKD